VPREGAERKATMKYNERERKVTIETKDVRVLVRLDRGWKELHVKLTPQAAKGLKQLGVNVRHEFGLEASRVNRLVLDEAAHRELTRILATDSFVNFYAPSLAEPCERIEYVVGDRMFGGEDHSNMTDAEWAEVYRDFVLAAREPLVAETHDDVCLEPYAGWPLDKAYANLRLKLLAMAARSLPYVVAQHAYEWWNRKELAEKRERKHREFMDRLRAEGKLDELNELGAAVATATARKV
jgi:hypothetical protein